MNDFHHRLSSSPSIKPSTISKDVNENEPIYQQTSPSLQDNTKPMPKNYMSTTISAASKANVPRKKILGDRNEASEPSSFETKFEKISILDHSHESLSQSNGGSEDDAHEADLPSRPYDPLTNYLSPRPQFLRFKPNRRHCRVIFRDEENEDEEAKEEGFVSERGSLDSLKATYKEDAASDAGDSSSSSSSSSMTQEKEHEEVMGANDEIEESDEEEIEEEEEDKGCNLKGLFKSLFMLAALVLSIMFVSSMNSSTPMRSLRYDVSNLDEYRNIQNHTFSQKEGLEVKEHVFYENMAEAIWLKKHESIVDSMYQSEEEIQVNIMEEENVDVEVDIEEESYEEIESTDELKKDDDDAVRVAEGETKSKVEDFGHVVEPQIEDNIDEFSQDLLEPSEDYQVPIFSKEQNNIEEVYDEEVSRDEDETKLNDENLTQMETKFPFEVLVAGLILSTIIAVLVLRFRLRAKPCSKPLQAKEEEISTDDSKTLPSKPYFESWKIEKCMEGLPSARDEHIDEVEFLGEFVVREIRNIDVENRRTEVEEINFSVSTENLGDKSHSVSIQSQPAHSEFSVMDNSPSQGSYAGKKKNDGVDGELNNVMMTPIAAKRSSRKGEAKVETATPVRRSSRIRSRAVLSP